MSNAHFTRLQFNDPNIEIGDHTYGSPTIHYPAPGSRLKMGRYCSIGWNVRIFLQTNHNTEWVSTYPFSAMAHLFPTAGHVGGLPCSNGDVVVGNDVWLAPETIVASGVTIGDGAVTMQGAVVFEDIAPYAIYAGNPATFVKWRIPEHLIAPMLKIKWWDWPDSRVMMHAADLCSGDIEGFIERHSD